MIKKNQKNNEELENIILDQVKELEKIFENAPNKMLLKKLVIQIVNNLIEQMYYSIYQTHRTLVLLI